MCDADFCMVVVASVTGYSLGKNEFNNYQNRQSIGLQLADQILTNYSDIPIQTFRKLDLVILVI